MAGEADEGDKDRKKHLHRRSRVNGGEGEGADEQLLLCGDQQLPEPVAFAVVLVQE